ncbi:MAG: hypothetical protein A2161_12690 [Candidatus Schekmanbacteria bacterium RBG_13_48_7]|uniref:Rubrerythrin diiron-binding domain-containing protein n=1 Tax=Candidatus Schekmanbacteria bacterium RBG_13_48_7 TaxID=1817878 RepID=A0A1F7S2T0_9BACT|nr:MAG: hypothetical protein A2161_12690 [Candidatus Schekmanbacteria bacterium RBG_13_48_7]
MNSESKEILKSLKTAIELENKGLLTFLKLARQTQNGAGKNMFIQLAMDEQKHREILEGQLEKIISGKPFEKISIAASAIEKLLPVIRDKAKKIKGEAGVDEIDALNAALDLETKAQKFFTEQAAQTTNPEAKNLFVRLAEWEDNHYKLIQAELDALQQTGFWFDMPEFQMDGKI